MHHHSRKSLGGEEAVESLAVFVVDLSIEENPAYKLELAD